MQNFHFRLATVLKVREVQLRTEELKLETLLSGRLRIEMERDQMERSLAETWDASKAQPVLETTDLAAMRAFADSARRQRALFLSQLTAQDALIARQRSITVEARRNVRLLEKLREQREAEWQLETDRQLAALVDDGTSAQWARRRREAQLLPSHGQNVTNMQTLPTKW